MLLVDPNEPQNPQAVREFGLALLHVALQAGGPALANVPALSSLLSHDLALGLIMNAEACGSIGTEEGEVGVAFAWRAGDVLLIDNRRVMHDGLPGFGPRQLRALFFDAFEMPQAMERRVSGVFDAG